MNTTSHYTKKFVYRYHLRGHLWKGMASLLGVAHPDLRSEQSIPPSTVRQALLSDLLSIRQDSKRALLGRGVVLPRKAERRADGQHVLNKEP